MTESNRLPRFVQIHSLHTYPAALLNRDDAGMAKRLPYGGAVRTRVSSQSLKRHWRFPNPVGRDADSVEVLAVQRAEPCSLQNLGVDMSVRTRYVGEEIARLIAVRGVPEVDAHAAAAGVLQAVFGQKEKPAKTTKPIRKGKTEETDVQVVEAESASLQTAQAVLFGRAEIEYLAARSAELSMGKTGVEEIREAVAKGLGGREHKLNLAAMKLGSGLESALFGRMVTSDMLAHRDASVYVAHSFTVHEAQVENDYFTVVDDLGRERGEAGGAGIFDTELASGLYYGYVVIDVPQLVANLEGIPVSRCFDKRTPVEQRDLASRVVRSFLHLVATVSPGAKRGSTAPFGYAQHLMVEAGDWQPRSLAAAFHEPVPLTGAPALSIRAAARMSDELTRLDAAYGASTARVCLDRLGVDWPSCDRTSLTTLADRAAQWVREGRC